MSGLDPGGDIPGPPGTGCMAAVAALVLAVAALLLRKGTRP